jgi:hypothetical protein
MAAKNPFKETRTIAEVYAVARTLRSQGVDDAKVNEMVSKRKAELLKATAKFDGLQKIHPVPYPLQSPQVSSLTLTVQHISENHIEIDNSGLITL